MSCQGCAGACTRILKRIDGVETVETDLPNQLVTVGSTERVDPHVMLEALKQWATAANKTVELQTSTLPGCQPATTAAT